MELHIPLTLLEELVACGAQACGEWAELVADITEQHTRSHDHHTDLDSRPGARIPGTALRRHTEIRDRTCTFVGCRAHAAEQDHTHDHHHGGATVRANLGPLCPHDHAVKHDGGWRLEQPRPGHFCCLTSFSHVDVGAVAGVEPGDLPDLRVGGDESEGRTRRLAAARAAARSAYTPDRRWLLCRRGDQHRRQELCLDTLGKTDGTPPGTPATRTQVRRRPQRARLTVFTTEDDLTLANALADAADAIATRYFRQPGLQTQTKADGSLVTAADRLVEAALRKHLLRHRPGDTFVGEESGTCGHGGRRWFVDPIDGTAGFVAGRPDWRTLIAVEHLGTITMGLVSSPALHMRWWATRAGGAWARHDDGYMPGTPDAADIPLAVTDTTRLEQATVALWPVVADLPEPLRAPVTRLVARSAQSRPRERVEHNPAREFSTASGTRHGALLVATGQIDAFLLGGGGPWDLAALVPIVEEAGGRFSDVTGGRSLNAPAALFSNGVLHEEILHCLLEDAN